MVTPISEWEPQAEDVPLPSGKVAKLKRPDLVDMIAGEGEIPDLLSNLVMNLTVNGKAKEITLDTMTNEQLKELMKSLNVIAIACFVEPRLWEGDEQRADGAIPVKWVAFNDKAAVMAWALGGKYQASATFPAKANGHLDAVSAVPTVRKRSK
jgi:hypothetical protein